jgi:2-isopropylmalate synthase
MHASGIHQDGVLKERETYEIIDPEIVGIPSNLIILSARSGRHALRHRLEELGYQAEQDELNEIYARFLKLADQKKEVYDEDLHVLMGNSETENSGIEIKNLSVSTNGASASAAITMVIDGEERTDAACGNGPVDAVFKSIDRLIGKTVQLEDYSLKSVSQGTEALGDATVKIRFDNRLIVGRGISTDIFEASAKAYVNALSKTNI